MFTWHPSAPPGFSTTRELIIIIKRMAFEGLNFTLIIIKVKYLENMVYYETGLSTESQRREDLPPPRVVGTGSPCRLGRVVASRTEKNWYLQVPGFPPREKLELLSLASSIYSSQI